MLLREDSIMATRESCGRASSPGAAALLSLFYMGLGHIYIGEIRKGILLVLLYTGSLALIPVLVGLVTTPMLWVRGMVYAYRSAEERNRQIVGEPVVRTLLARDFEPEPELVLAAADDCWL